MACYSTVGEQPQSRVGRQGLANRQDSNLSFSSISTLPWKRESILNLATAGDRQSWKHSLLDPGHKSFRPEADCQLHYECNDPISRYSILIEQAFIAQHAIALRCFALKTLAEDLASQTPEYRWKDFVECNICQIKGRNMKKWRQAWSILQPVSWASAETPKRSHSYVVWKYFLGGDCPTRPQSEWKPRHNLSKAENGSGDRAKGVCWPHVQPAGGQPHWA